MVQITHTRDGYGNKGPGGKLKETMAAEPRNSKSLKGSEDTI
jgi:hypothetical protein